MEKIVLKATLRTVIGKQVGVLRREGKLPAVMYGRHFESTPITLELRDTTRKLAGLTASSIVTIELDGKEHAALLQEKQRDFIRNTLKHIDFRIVSMDEKVRTHVAVEITGTAPAVKDYNGIVNVRLNELEVEALPQDLPERIVIDVSGMKHIGDKVSIGDVKIAASVHLFHDLSETLVVISAPEGEAVEGAIATATGFEEPEVIEKGKKEDEAED